MKRGTGLCGVVTCLLLVLAARGASAQSTLQLWDEFDLDWARTHRQTYSLDFEPKVLLDPSPGQPGWHTLDVIPSANYAWKGWLDLLSEVKVGYTKQTNQVNSTELTPRVGTRFHLFSRKVPTVATHLDRELPPRRRIVIRDLVRVEWRNIYYSGDTTKAPSSTVRFRNRVEFEAALSKQDLTDNGVRYLLADWEWFIPVNVEPAERFASKQRIRAGLGYRRSFAWRFEALYIWDRSKDTIGEPYLTNNSCIDLRIKRVF